MAMICEIVERDRARVRDHFAEICEIAGVSQENAAEKAMRILAVVSKALKIHMAFKEEAFYPAVREKAFAGD
jgi:hypothetical protein